MWRLEIRQNITKLGEIFEPVSFELVEEKHRRILRPSETVQILEARMAFGGDPIGYLALQRAFKFTKQGFVTQGLSAHGKQYWEGKVLGEEEELSVELDNFIERIQSDEG